MRSQCQARCGARKDGMGPSKLWWAKDGMGISKLCAAIDGMGISKLWCGKRWNGNKQAVVRQKMEWDQASELSRSIHCIACAA